LLDDLETILLMAAARDLMGAPDEGE
jgi:hypothetical protein